MSEDKNNKFSKIAIRSDKRHVSKEVLIGNVRRFSLKRLFTGHGRTISFTMY